MVSRWYISLWWGSLNNDTWLALHSLSAFSNAGGCVGSVGLVDRVHQFIANDELVWASKLDYCAVVVLFLLPKRMFWAWSRGCATSWRMAPEFGEQTATMPLLPFSLVFVEGLTNHPWIESRGGNDLVDSARFLRDQLESYKQYF